MVERFAGKMSKSQHVLETLKSLGRTRDLGKNCRTFIREIDKKDQIKWMECLIDGSFVPAKKGAIDQKDQAGQEREAHGGGRRPEHLIADKAYDSDKLREKT